MLCHVSKTQGVYGHHQEDSRVIHLLVGYDPSHSLLGPTTWLKVFPILFVTKGNVSFIISTPRNRKIPVSPHSLQLRQKMTNLSYVISREILT